MRAAKRHGARENPKMCFLNSEQAKRFLAAVHGDRYEALYVLALTSGMRQGEMFGLQWPDLDLARGKLTIHRALQRTKRRRSERETHDAYSLQPPKTAASRRTIEIPPVTVGAIRQHQQRQEELRTLAGDEWHEGGLVFTSKRGTPLDTSNVLHHFQEILKGAELPKIRFYDLRHTHASLLIAEGVHPKKIAERLGHASIKLTMDTYGHLFEGSDRESAERMERLFGQRTEEPKPHADRNVIRIDRRGPDSAEVGAADFLLTKTGRSADKKHHLSADKTADKTGWRAKWKSRSALFSMVSAAGIEPATY
jgi:integrase